MKIVNKQEFYKLPEGTIYSNYEPCVFDGLKIKQSTIYDGDKPIDFFFENLIGNIDAKDSVQLVDVLIEAEENKTSIKLDFNCCERDGLYDENALYAIYEPGDIEKLVSKLIYTDIENIESKLNKSISSQLSLLHSQ